MVQVIADRVLETSTTTGTGAFTLAGAITGYRAFSAVCSTSDTVYYTIYAVDGNGNPSGAWESGLGTYSGANTLTRTTVHASTNSNAAVDFGAGTKYVMLTATAKQVGLFAPQEWQPNFSADGEVRIRARVAMTITQQATSGTGSVAYEKSTAAAPSTFSSTSSPISLEAGAWLKVSATGVSGLYAVALERTA